MDIGENEKKYLIEEYIEENPFNDTCRKALSIFLTILILSAMIVKILAGFNTNDDTDIYIALPFVH